MMSIVTSVMARMKSTSVGFPAAKESKRCCAVAVMAVAYPPKRLDWKATWTSRRCRSQVSPSVMSKPSPFHCFSTFKGHSKRMKLLALVTSNSFT